MLAPKSTIVQEPVMNRSEKREKPIDTVCSRLLEEASNITQYYKFIGVIDLGTFYTYVLAYFYFVDVPLKWYST